MVEGDGPILQTDVPLAVGVMDPGQEAVATEAGPDCVRRQSPAPASVGRGRRALGLAAPSLGLALRPGLLWAALYGVQCACCLSKT